MQRLLIVVLAALLTAPNADADQSDARAASEELIARGVDARLHERHEEALDLFRKAHVLSPSARTFAQMGLAELSLHRWLEAEEHLATALDRHDVPWVEDLRVRGVLEQALVKARGHIGTLKIVGTPGAEILIDGRSAGTLPISQATRLSEGKARIAATAPGRTAAENEVEIVGGHETTTRIDLLLTSLVPPPAAASVAPSLRAAAPPTPPDHASPPPAASTTNGWRTWTGAGALLVSAGAIVTGVMLLKIDSHPTCSAPPGVECPGLYDTKALGLVSFGGAIAGTAAGITLLAWHPRTTQATASLMPMGIGVGARF
jgi:hypothetical protein